MEIIQNTGDIGKIVVLPAFDTQKNSIKLMKIDHPQRDLIMGPRQILEPNPRYSRQVPLECIDIAIIPGIALDEKGGRMPALSERRNIVVIADEAHRSQYDMIDGLARHMRDSLPKFTAASRYRLALEKLRMALGARIR